MNDRLDRTIRRVKEVSGRWFGSPPEDVPPREAGGLRVYMHPVELSQLFALLHALGPRRCLEWGSGGGTLAILEECPFIERYVSVEHDAAWHARVLEHAKDERLSLQLVEPDRPIGIDSPTEEQIIAWDATGEQDDAVMASYVRYPSTLDTQFDFVLVDGRARVFCLAAGFELLRPGGVIVLHDAQRTQYHQAFHDLGPQVVFLEPWHQGQIALVRKPD
jgi:SAM-dependent methyltransferase